MLYNKYLINLVGLDRTGAYGPSNFFAVYGPRASCWAIKRRKISRAISSRTAGHSVNKRYVSQNINRIMIGTIALSIAIYNVRAGGEGLTLTHWLSTWPAGTHIQG